MENDPLQTEYFLHMLMASRNVTIRTFGFPRTEAVVLGRSPQRLCIPTAYWKCCCGTKHLQPVEACCSRAKALNLRTCDDGGHGANAKGVRGASTADAGGGQGVGVPPEQHLGTGGPRTPAASMYAVARTAASPARLATHWADQIFHAVAHKDRELAQRLYDEVMRSPRVERRGAYERLLARFERGEYG